MMMVVVWLWMGDDGNTLENKVICRKTETPPAMGAGGVQKGKPMMIPDLELPACLLGIVAETKSVPERLAFASDWGAPDAMAHVHGRRPQGRLGMAWICCFGVHVR
jgi:hypothetical protein